MDQPACPRLPICDGEKKARANLASRINQGFYQIQFSLTEVLHIRSIFSFCLAVLWISRMSEYLMTQWYFTI